MKKTLVTAGVAAVVAATGVGGMGLAYADTSSSSTTSTNPMSSLVQAIADKFNLKTSDVQAVFDEQHTEMEAQRTAEVKEELATLVKDGKLTQAQSDAILAKRTELQEKRDSNRSKMDSVTESERRAAMDAEKTALDTWFSDNNISTDYRYLLMGGPGGHGGPGGPPSDTSSTSSSSSSDSSTSSDSQSS
ncbi:hypothetical protein KDA14_05270 [Candidatus Saccharibacteria bacterium]|nr:hypothetical protein [Candidatus Saccharibacteria bacterium]